MEGILIHNMIEKDYIIRFGSGRLIIPEYPIPFASTNNPGINFGKADIADLTSKQLYEIKPIASEPLGVIQLTHYLNYIEGGGSWTPGVIYSRVPIKIGPWPNNPSKDVYALMRIAGVIVYYGKNNKDNNSDPVYVLEYEAIKERAKNHRKVMVPCIVVTVTAIIALNPIPGDEIAIPVVLSRLIPLLAR